MSILRITINIFSVIIITAGAAAAQSKWTIQNSGTTRDLRGIAWTGSQFAAVGDSGTIITSPNAVDWTMQNSGMQRALKAVVWNGDTLLCVGDSGTILTSADGRSWTAQTCGTSSSLNAVAWSGAQFVTVGNAVLSSPDGVVWTSHSSFTMYSITWTGTEFVGVGNGNVVATSFSGATWTWNTIESARRFQSITWTGSQCIAAGAAGDIRSLRELIPGNWRTTVLPDSPVTSHDLFAVKLTGSRLLVAGDAGTIASSVNGTAWTVQTSGTNQRLNAITCSDSLIVVAGDSGIILTASIDAPSGVSFSAARKAGPTVLLQFREKSARITLPPGFTAKETRASRASVYSLSGAKIMNVHLNGACVPLQVLRSGTYLFSIGSGEGKMTLPFVIR